MTNQTLVDQLSGIVGAENVLVSDSDRAGFDRDITGKYRGRSLAVVQPKSTAEVSAVMRLAFETATPVVPQGGNTGLAGAASVNDAGDSIVLSLRRMNRIDEINPQSRIARVEAGVILDNLHRAAAEHGLIFPLFFGARGSCMIGGNLSTNAGGSNVLRYGNTRALCLGLEVVQPDGEVVNLMSELYKDNTGYDLKDLFIGAEGTLGVITGAVLRLFSKPKAYATATLAVRSLDDALSLLHRLNEASGGAVEAFEYMPRAYMELLFQCFPKMRPPFDTAAEVIILVELGVTSARDATPGPDGTLPVTGLLQETLAEMMERGEVLDAVVAQNEAQRMEMWEWRESAYEVVHFKGHAVSADIAVPTDRVQTFLDRMEPRLRQIAPGAKALCVAHLGDGNLHYSVSFGTHNRADPALCEAVITAVEDTVQSLGGSFSAEHGIGLSKRSTMARCKDRAALALMRRIKQALDPKNVMNPGKVLPD